MAFFIEAEKPPSFMKDFLAARRSAFCLASALHTARCVARQVAEFSEREGSLGKRLPSLRPIPEECDPNHDKRADCDHHWTDKTQLLQHSDNPRPPDKISLHTHESPACHSHSDNSVWPPAAAV